ncbi:MAG: EMC3/TMCO1 family protein, partial [Halobacteria archaeon]|nr:EMC3/TMCO1 family protein [Halobacteria archaeon]
MPVEGIESLLENPAMVEAISTVFERTEGGNKELEWEDVSGSLSSEQWGRLISEGVLVSTGGGFAVANPEALEKELNKHQSQGGTEAHEGAIGSVSWEWHDKVAAVAAICLFVGYWNTDVREAVASVDNIILAPIAEVLPFYAVMMLLSVVTGFYSTVLQSKLTESEKIQAYKDRMEGLKERKKAAKERDDGEALDRIREEQ